MANAMQAQKPEFHPTDTEISDARPAPSGPASPYGDSTRNAGASLRSALRAAAGAAVTSGLALLLLQGTGSTWAAVAGILLGSAGFAFWGYRRRQKSIALFTAIQANLDALANGGQFVPVVETGLDASQEQLAGSFNRIFEHLGGIAARIFGVVENAGALDSRIGEAMGDIESSADAQEEAVEETASLIANINNSMQDISERIERLQRAAEESASSILEMGTSIDEVARNAATLHESVEASTSSVHEMGASIRQVAESAEQVERMAEETASSMIEMDRTVQEVTKHAREASELTLKVSDGAERGSQAVSETIADIQCINDRTSEARAVLAKLVGRISEIGGILNVIGEINDETNLLSLNAAIIAAQAGEQGKAFLVVANHVKTLARRTESSTKDIARLIGDVERGSADAVTAMNAGVEAIETGVSRSKAAGDSLAEILTSSREAQNRVEGIAHSTHEQSRSSKMVSQAAQETSTQVQQISSAMAEQSKVSEQMLERAEAALDACGHVHRSTDQQRETGRYISQSISSITEMIRLIRENAANHAQASESVSGAVTRMLNHAQKSGEQVPAIKAMLGQLREGDREIGEQVARFQGGQLGAQSD